MQKKPQIRNMDVGWPQASRFCTIPHFTVLSVLNCNTKRNALQAEHVLQMHG